MPSLRSCSVGPPRSAIHGRARLTRHPCRVAHYAEPPLGLSRGRCIKIKSEAADRPAWLEAGMYSSRRSCRRLRSFDLAVAVAVALLRLWICLPLSQRPNAGVAQGASRHGCRDSRPRPWMADGGGPPEQCRSEGMPSLGEAPNGGAKALWLLSRFSKVTRRKGGTLSGRYRRNGYVHHQETGRLSGRHREQARLPQGITPHPPRHESHHGAKTPDRNQSAFRADHN
jgi:hypothetical protein